MRQDGIEIRKWPDEQSPDEAAIRKILDDEGLKPYSWSNSWNRLSFTSPRFMNKKRFNECSKRFSFGQLPVDP